jgi:hypothetical protein
MIEGLREQARHLQRHEREVVDSASLYLETRGFLSQKQVCWLEDLHSQYTE